MSCYEILAGSCSCLHDGLMFEDVRSALKFNRVFRDLSAEEHRMIEQKFVHVQSPKHKLLFELSFLGATGPSASDAHWTTEDGALPGRWARINVADDLPR